MNFLIADTFTDSLDRLTGDEQKARTADIICSTSFGGICDIPAMHEMSHIPPVQP